MSYIWVRTDKQDMGKQCYPLLEYARKPQLHTVEFGVDLANVSKEVNPGLEKQILFNKSCEYFVQHDPALTTAWQLHSGLNLFEGMCKTPRLRISETCPRLVNKDRDRQAISHGWRVWCENLVWYWTGYLGGCGDRCCSWRS